VFYSASQLSVKLPATRRASLAEARSETLIRRTSVPA
jgi:hypothetical protein